MIVEEIARGARVSAGLVVDSGNLHAPFRLHALLLGRCVDFMWTLQDVLAASAA